VVVVIIIKVIIVLMKILILVTLSVVLATCLKPIHAGELSVSTGLRSMNTADDVYSIGYWNYLKVSYQPEDSGFYYGLSHETAEVRPIYYTHSVSLTGLFVGIKTNVTQNVRLFANVGYYIVKNNFGGKQRKHVEGFYYYLNDRFGGAPYVFDEYDLITSKDTVGAEIGIEITQPINDNWSVGFTASHRLLKISETIAGYRDDWTAINSTWKWQQQSIRDYSSTDFGVGVNYDY